MLIIIKIMEIAKLIIVNVKITKMITTIIRAMK